MASKELEDLKARLQKISKDETKSQSYNRVKQTQPKIPAKPVQPTPKRLQPEEEIEANFEDEMKQLAEEEEISKQNMPQELDEEGEYSEEEYQEEVEEEPVPKRPVPQRPQPQQPIKKPVRPVPMPVQQQEEEYYEEPPRRVIQKPQPQRPVQPQQQTQQTSEQEMEKFREQLTSEIIRLRDSGQFAVEIIFQLNRLNTNIEALINALSEE